METCKGNVFLQYTDAAEFGRALKEATDSAKDGVRVEVQYKPIVVKGEIVYTALVLFYELIPDIMMLDTGALGFEKEEHA